MLLGDHETIRVWGLSCLSPCGSRISWTSADMKLSVGLLAGDGLKVTWHWVAGQNFLEAN